MPDFNAQEAATRLAAIMESQNTPNAVTPSVPGVVIQDGAGLPLFASADPQQDADYLMWLMQPPKPYTPWIDLFHLEQQLRMEPQQRFINPERPRPDRLIPPREQW